jgi:hypothetical protein
MAIDHQLRNLTVVKVDNGTASPALSALIRKRAEVAGQIIHLDTELRRLQTALEHLDATIVFLNPGIKPSGIRSRRVPHRPPVLPELARTVLDLMRRANEPLTAHEMAVRLLNEHGLDKADLTRLADAVGGCMNRGDGRLVEPLNRHKRPARWRLIG